MSSDTYECDFCGFPAKWDEHESGYRGDIWECEYCGRHFCTGCFINGLGRPAFDHMLRETDVVVCPDCYTENRLNVKECD